jgi:hypothetical protein
MLEVAIGTFDIAGEVVETRNAYKKSSAAAPGTVWKADKDMTGPGDSNPSSRPSSSGSKPLYSLLSLRAASTFLNVFADEEPNFELISSAIPRESAETSKVRFDRCDRPGPWRALGWTRSAGVCRLRKHWDGILVWRTHDLSYLGWIDHQRRPVRAMGRISD